MSRKKKIVIIVVTVLLTGAIWGLTPGPVESYVGERTISAPGAIVWEVLADVDGYENYATTLHDAQIISGTGEGMVRSCRSDAGGWTETCTDWEEGKSYSFLVDTKAADYPFPFKHVRGTWSLEPLSDEVTHVTVRFEYQFSMRWIHWLYNGATQKVFDEGNSTLFDNYESEILSRK